MASVAFARVAAMIAQLGAAMAKQAGAMSSCASIGYQGRSIDAFCKALVVAGVSTLVDVRERAWSHRPEYRKEALRAALARSGVDYIHCKIAGNPFRPKAGEKLDPDACREVYSKHLAQHPEVLDELEPLVRERRVALFCYEAERSHCHRGVLIDALIKRRRGLKPVDL